MSGGETGVVNHRTGFGGDERCFVPGHIGQDLEGPDDVEHCEVRVEGECDLHLASSGLSVRSAAVRAVRSSSP